MWQLLTRLPAFPLRVYPWLNKFSLYLSASSPNYFVMKTEPQIHHQQQFFLGECVKLEENHSSNYGLLIDNHLVLENLLLIVGNKA